MTAPTRVEKVYAKLRELTSSLSFSNNNVKYGFEAGYISGLTGIDRANVSRELNTLVRMGKVTKIKGKPVLYLDRTYFREKWNIYLNPVLEDYAEFISMLKEKGILREQKNIATDKTDLNLKFLDNSLDSLIGAQHSLKEQITKAKAAILYPVDGLHTLIVGPTGVGKTTFAEAMYEYAIQLGVLPKKSSFIPFNCADYAENVQLLMSQLFGYVKGAFTGADKEKRGLIDEADGGILFLDEVHRLPPEGQEMLFTLIDKGIYRRLGESDNTRKAKVRVIAATTEDPESVLLRTFLRRIPVVIQLPSLEKRTLKERFMFIHQFFWEESRRIELPIKISKEVLKALLLYDCPGNIGQLKNDIRLICAKAFLEHMMAPSETVEIEFSKLALHIQEGLLKIRQSKQDEGIFAEIDRRKDFVIDGRNTGAVSEINKKFFISHCETEEDFYEMIINDWIEYNKAGLPPEEIRAIIEGHIKEYYEENVFSRQPDSLLNREVVLKFVSPKVLEAVEYAFYSVKDELEGLIERRILYTIALHISTLLERLKKGIVISHGDKANIGKDYPHEYTIAQKIKAKLDEKLSVQIPESEIAFLTMFLHALRIGKKDESIGILVIMHGDCTASAMANVANTLLGVNHARALDMPLDEKVEVVLDKACDIVTQIDKGKGVLLLVDMGSLTAFSNIISQRTQILTRTIGMVSTPIVIEATRKALMPGITLDELVMELKSSYFTIYDNNDSITAEHVQIDFGNNLPFFKKNLIEILDKTLIFLNPNKAYDILEDTLKKILSDICCEIDEEILIKFLFHCSCMIERVIRGDSLHHNNLDFVRKQQPVLFEAVKKHFESTEEFFGISIPDTELAYVVEMIGTCYGLVGTYIA